MSPTPLILAAVFSALSLLAQETTKKITAGPFTMLAPSQWGTSAIVEKIPPAPLYRPADWKTYQENSLYALKPGFSTRPQHWAIRFPSLVLPGAKFDALAVRDDETAPQILIHPSEEWSGIFKDGSSTPDEAKQTVQKLRKELDSLKTTLPLGIHTAYVDASLGFVCLKKPLQFKGGSGYRMIGQWMIEPDLVRRGVLHYLFVGLSDDNTCQILATFPLDAPDLPSPDSDARHLGRSTTRYEELSKGMPAYSAEAVQWLEQREKTFTPSLEALDRMIESLSAASWK